MVVRDTGTPAPERLSTLSGARAVLLGGSALLVCASLQPWYRVEGRGFVLEASGWHELGVLAWILTLDLLGWELLRLTRAAPVRGARADRLSASGGLVVTAVAGIFVLQRLSEGGLGWGWFLGAALVVALGAASVRLFVDADGPQAVATRLGDGAPSDDDEDRAAVDGTRPRPGGSPVSRPPAPPQAGGGVVPGRLASARTVGGRSVPGRGSRPPVGSGVVPGRPSRPEDGGSTARFRRPLVGDDPVPGGWAKTPAERQRDAPPLWSGRTDPGRGRRDDDPPPSA